MAKAPIASARLPLQRAHFFLGKVEAMTEVDRAELDHYLTAGIVFGRSVFHYLEKAAELTTDRSYRTWFGKKALEIKSDVLLEHFRDVRNTEIHVRRVPLQRHVTLTVDAVVRTSAYGEMRITRTQPWYRRSPSILWQDLWASMMRPVKRWRYQLGEWSLRRRAQIDAGVERVQARFRKPAKVSVMEFFFDDPEGLDRPAVVLVQDYLSRWEAIITEGETTFPQVFR